MKKLLALSVAVMFLGNTYAQDGDGKKFHFGLKAEPQFSWYKPDDKKKFENGGLAMKFGFGLMTDFALSENIWLSTGLGLQFDGGKIRYLDTLGYGINNNEIVTFDQNGAAEVDPTQLDTNAVFITLTERSFKANYVNLPIFLKMKTKEIGMMTYFGQFGFNVGVKTRGRADDVGTIFGSTAVTPDLSDLNIDSEMALLKVQLGIGGGAEYNLSGSTSLLFGATFNYGITNAVNKKSEHLLYQNQLAANGNPLAYNEQKFIPFNVAITVGILF